MRRITGSDQRPNAFEQFGNSGPTWENRSAVIKKIRGYLQEVEENPFPEEPTERALAIQRARQGNPDELIRFVEEGPRPRRAGRPRMSKAEKVRKTPTHRAGAFVYLTKLILHDHYPKKTKRQITDRAIEAVAAIEKISEVTLRNYTERSKKSRGRIF